jgi:hypothetical protein
MACRAYRQLSPAALVFTGPTVWSDERTGGTQFPNGLICPESVNVTTRVKLIPGLIESDRAVPLLPRPGAIDHLFGHLAGRCRRDAESDQGKRWLGI